jgi:hypothetical protein
MTIYLEIIQVRHKTLGCRSQRRAKARSSPRGAGPGGHSPRRAGARRMPSGARGRWPRWAGACLRRRRRRSRAGRRRSPVLEVANTRRSMRMRKMFELMEKTQDQLWRNACISDTPGIQQQAAATTFAQTNRNSQGFEFFDSRNVGAAVRCVHDFDDGGTTLQHSEQMLLASKLQQRTVTLQRSERKADIA